MSRSNVVQLFPNGPPHCPKAITPEVLDEAARELFEIFQRVDKLNASISEDLDRLEKAMKGEITDDPDAGEDL